MDNPSILKVEDFILRFTAILYEALPFIILGAVIAGILEEMLPQKLITRFLPRSRTLAILIGALLGIIFPMCECGIIPVMRRLLRKGLPLSCCVAYLLAGPIINFVVMGSTFVAFSGMENTTESNGGLSYQMGSWWMVGFRVGLGFLVSVGTAHIVEWQYRKYGNKLLLPLAIPSTLPLIEDEDAPEAKRSPWQRISNIADTALHDFIDITVFLILGALLAAFMRQVVTEQMIAQLSRDHAVLAIGLMMLLAVLLSLCSEADAFVAASFATLRPSAKLAFLVLGPMLDLKLYLMYTRVFRPRLIYTIFLAVIVQVFVYSYVTHLFWEHFGPQIYNWSPRIPWQRPWWW
ncbi:MAG TPA: permease [Gemmataceae bacterium]|nr:permease [Gemmataceae bacterium]